MVEPYSLLRAEVAVARAIVARLPRLVPELPHTRLLLTPFPEGSRGDEALLLGSLGIAKGNAIVLSHRPNRRLRGLVTFPFRSWLVPGLIYSVPPFSFVSTFVFLLRARRCGVLTVVGADLLDGAYWVGPSVRRWLLPAALSSLGVAVEVVGFSWPSQPHPDCRRAMLESAPSLTLRPRDDISLKRLHSLGITHASAGTDVALGIEPTTHSAGKNFNRWVDEQRGAGRRILALGPNGHTLSSGGDADLLSSLLKTNSHPWALLLVPMDERFFAADRRRATALERRARRAGIPVFTLSRGASVRELIASVRQVDAVLTFRMHLAVLAFHAGVPSIGVDYNDKFHGVFRHFDVEEYVIPHASLLSDVGRVWKSLSESLEDLTHRVRIAGQRNHELARESFQALSSGFTD